MIGFQKEMDVSKQANAKLVEIFNTRHNAFNQYHIVSGIDNLDVAKIVIRRLLDHIQANS